MAERTIQCMLGSRQQKQCCSAPPRSISREAEDRQLGIETATQGIADEQDQRPFQRRGQSQGYS
jgi:hypothetical protein